MTFLDYFALFLLCLSLTAVFFLFIYIHDLPYKIAKERDHPQAEAIGVAQWLALFTAPRPSGRWSSSGPSPIGSRPVRRPGRPRQGKLTSPRG